MKLKQVAQRSGSVLAMVMAIVLAIGLLCTSFCQRVLSGCRVAAWSREHLALRLVAESAVEEVFLAFSDRANTPGNPVFDRLRTATPGADIALSDLAPTDLVADLAARSAEFGGAVTLDCHVKLTKITGLSADAAETAGLVRIEATVTVARKGIALTERVRSDRSFQTARTVLPAPLDSLALFVLDPDVAGLPHAPMQAAADESARTLVKMFTDKRFVRVPPQLATSVATALSTFSPEALARRAQFVTSSASQLGAFLASRLSRGQPVNGLIYNTSDEPFRVPSIAGFRGRAILVIQGDVRVGEITVEQPGRDSLTIVSGGRIIVEGRTVEANLLTLAPGRGVLFARQARVAGTMISSRFPRGPRMSRQEMEQCEFGTLAGLDTREPLARYFVTLSVNPINQEHRRQGEEWSEW